jgi:brefeldin A-inhibited guanine nucleotide-exchange protein
MVTPVEAFVVSLINQTSLLKPVQNEFTVKNVMNIQAMLLLAANEGNCLKASWKHVIKCVSRIDELLTLAGGAKKVFNSSQVSKRDEAKKLIE